MPMFKCESLVWDVPFFHSCRPSDAQRLLVEGAGWAGREERCEQMEKNGIGYQNARVGFPAEKSEQKEAFHYLEIDGYV